MERALGRKRVNEVRARYVGIDKDAAIDLALETSPRPSTVGAGAQKSPLKKREGEIARLIAQGISNRAIPEALFISPRTVDGHVERILAKLDFTSQTQVATWVAGNAAAPGSGG